MNLSLSIGIGSLMTRGRGGAPSYDPDADALFARMQVQPDAARKGQINSLIVGLKAAGVWAKLDFLYMLAAHDAQAARLNWVASDELTAIASPVFTPDRGYKGDGSAAYLESVFNQAHMPKAEYTNGSWLLGVRDAGTLANRFVIGAATNVRFAYIPFVSSGAGGNVRNTQGTMNDVISSPLTGRFGSTRSAIDRHDVYYNGAPTLTSTSVQQQPSGTPILIFRGGSVYSDAAVTYYAAGAGLTAQQHAAADAALSTYLTAVGAQ